MKAIRRIVERESEHLDRVIISGDISHYGDEDNLQLARQWMYGSFEAEDKEQISLGLGKQDHWKIKLVPGNHDAWNSKSTFGRIIDKRQKSLENFNAVFGGDTQIIPLPNGYYYDWIQKGDRALFMVYLDSSFIGDTEIEKDNPELKYFDKIAKGKVSKKQAESVLSLYDQGIKGKLRHPSNEAYIDGIIFSKALKIVVMHHYLFEPQGQKIEPLLHVHETERVFMNFAFADIDILMCGHKHYSENRTHLYITHFNRRAKARYMFNYFRRLIGIHSLPVQYTDAAGKKSDKFVSAIISLFLSNNYRQLRKEDYKINMDFVNDLSDIFTKGLDDPDKFGHEMQRFIGKYKSDAPDESFMDENELCEIIGRLKTSWIGDDRKKIKRLVRQVKKIVRKLSSRHFLQLMAGSACKAQENEKKLRSFNIYRIYAKDDGYVLRSEKYNWNAQLNDYGPNPEINDYHFHDQNRPLH